MTAKKKFDFLVEFEWRDTFSVEWILSKRCRQTDEVAAINQIKEVHRRELDESGFSKAAKVRIDVSRLTDKKHFEMRRETVEILNEVKHDY